MSATNRTLQLRSKKRQEELKRIAQMRLDAGVATPGMRVEVQKEEDPAIWKRRKLILGMLMAPVCLLGIVVFFDLFFHATVQGGFWRSEGFWFFAFGCLFWFTLGWMKMQPSVIYVFAHEMTHAITARLSGAKVHDMHVDDDGGYIETDKTNVFITLSPYLVPFYTVVVFAIYGLLSLVLDMQHVISLPFLGWVLKWSWAFYFFVGLSWCFHLTFTMQVLETEQSDLLHNGEFFSMMLIILINLIILGALFIAASPTVGWIDVWNHVTGLWR
jgi:hypothetical protein